MANPPIAYEVDMGVQRITVGLDGSEHAQRALDWAGALALQTGAELIAAHV